MSAVPKNRATDKFDVAVVVRLNADGNAVQVEDRYGTPLNPVDTYKDPVQGTVKALTSMVLMTTHASPDCTWYYINGKWYKVCD
ncbi:MAG: hypothetical protein PVI91_10320 [Gammaproteobacteria bacterium]|jgi:hypothetical protein